MLKKPYIFFGLGVYITTSVMCLSFLIATYIYGDTSGIPIKSFVDFVEICLGFLSLLTIPALFILAVVQGTIPERLKASFYDLYTSRNSLFICGAIIPIAMLAVPLLIYTIFSLTADFLSFYWVVFTGLVALFFVSPLAVKLLIMLRKKNSRRIRLR